MDIKNALKKTVVAAMIGMSALGMAGSAAQAFNAASAPTPTISATMQTGNEASKPAERTTQIVTAPVIWKWHNGVDANGNPTHWRTWVPT